MSVALTGITREIAEAISAANRRVASNERRDITVVEMAQAVAAMLERKTFAPLIRQVANYENSLEHTSYIDIVGDEIADSDKDTAFIRDVILITEEITCP